MRWCQALILLLVPAAAIAQTERPDSLRVSPADSVPSYMRPIPVDIDSMAAPAPCYDVDMRQYTLTEPHSMLKPAWQFAPRTVTLTPGGAGIVAWQGGSFSASGVRMSMPGMMGVESGSLNFSQSFGRLSLSASASATKYGYYRGLQTGYGISGSVSYRISDRWSVTAFGSYCTSLHPATMAMAEYMDVPNFGGYVSYDINEHWGVDMGARATRSLVTNRWEAQPIVRPYYKINGKAAIGVDVGGILYNIVSDYVNRHNHGPGINPTMGPPRPTPPPVAPRR